MIFLLSSTGDGPDPAEIFTAIKINDTKVAFKSGYGKYVTTESDGRLEAKVEAMGAREQFEPVFQDVSGCQTFSLQLSHKV